MKDLIDRQALCKYALNQKDKSITPNDIMRFPLAQPEYEPVTLEDFARTMSGITVWGFAAWQGWALALIKDQGFVICKKMM